MRALLLSLITAATFGTGAAAIAAPVPKGVPTPKPPQPDETFFPLNRSDYGTVVSVAETKIVLQPIPNGWRTVRLPSGDSVRQLVPIDETPLTFHVHPVMKNGGLADEACDTKAYQVKDLKEGDVVSLYHEFGAEKSRWLVAIAIRDRPKGEKPPPARTSKDWYEIMWDRRFARQERLKAKEDAAKNEKK